MSDVLTGGCVKDYYTFIAIAVCDKNFVGTGFHEEICWSSKAAWVIATFILSGRSNSENVVSIPGEFHYVVAVTRSEPHEIIVVDVDTMLLIEPGITFSWASPGL
jgi:hypothetical protein